MALSNSLDQMLALAGPESNSFTAADMSSFWTLAHLATL
jgi:hypothetical protein